MSLYHMEVKLNHTFLSPRKVCNQNMYNQELMFLLTPTQKLD